MCTSIIPLGNLCSSLEGCCCNSVLLHCSSFPYLLPLILMFMLSFYSLGLFVLGNCTPLEFNHVKGKRISVRVYILCSRFLFEKLAKLYHVWRNGNLEVKFPQAWPSK